MCIFSDYTLANNWQGYGWLWPDTLVYRYSRVFLSLSSCWNYIVEPFLTNSSYSQIRNTCLCPANKVSTYTCSICRSCEYRAFQFCRLCIATHPVLRCWLLYNWCHCSEWSGTCNRWRWPHYTQGKICDSPRRVQYKLADSSLPVDDFQTSLFTVEVKQPRFLLWSKFKSYAAQS